jgi:hypothetical protein
VEQNATKERRQKGLSTSALAKRNELKTAELFGWMESEGWIVRIDGHWSLTDRGREQGGQMQSSERFGTYITWPNGLRWQKNHGVVRRASVQSQTLHNATALVEIINQGVSPNARPLNAGTFNRLLLEAGFLLPNTGELQGWRVSSAGEALGGEQRSTKASIPFVVWPASILDETALARLLRLWQGSLSDSIGMSASHGHGYLSINGLWCKRMALLVAVNTLYLHRVAHQVGARLQGEPALEVDLYLPDHRVVVLISDPRASTDQLKHQHQVESICQGRGLTLWVFSEGEAASLEGQLRHQLKQHSV